MIIWIVGENLTKFKANMNAAGVWDFTPLGGDCEEKVTWAG